MVSVMKCLENELKEMLSVDLLELSTMKLEETKFSVKDLFPKAVKKYANQDSNLKVQYNVGDADADNVIISESFAKKILAEHPIDAEKEVIDNKIQAMQNCKMNEPYMASSKSDNMSVAKVIADEFLSLTLGRRAEVTPEIEISKSAQEMLSSKWSYDEQKRDSDER